MSDIVTTPPAPDAPAQPSSRPYADANSTLRAQGATWSSVAQAIDATATPEVAPKTDAEIEAAVLAETPVEETATETVETPAYEGWVVDEQGRLHRPDGSFANAGEIDSYNATIPAEATETVAEEVPAPYTLAIPGARSGESDVSIDFEGLTPEQQEGLARLKNGFMRGEDARAKIAKADEYLVERRAFETMMETNPEDLILQHLPKDKRITLAIALNAELWGDLAPTLVEFDNPEKGPEARYKAAMDARQRSETQKGEYERRVAQGQYITQAESTARGLVPEHVDAATAERFLTDAAVDLSNESRRRGQPVPVQDIPQFLAPRLALYGFDKPATTPGAAPSAPPRPVARPVAKPASQAATAPTPAAQNGKNGAHVRRAVTAQRIAAAVPHAGAGAASVKAPLVPANADLKQASKALRQQKSW